MADWKQDTIAVHGHSSVRAEGIDPVAPAIYYSSTFRFYTRYGNPTHAQAAEVLAKLEGTEVAMLTASGMGAISTAVLALVKAGDHCIAQTRHYMATAKLFDEMLRKFGVDVTIVEQTDLAAMEAAIRPNTRFIYVETPANPTLINANALALAAWLEARPEIEAVYYPMLPSHPQYDIAKKQMKGGGPVVAYAIKGGYEPTSKFVSGLKLASQAVSLGGVETLAVHTAAMWAGSLTEAQMRTAGIAPNFVRMSVGIEDIEDLERDFAQALEGSGAA
ncbi:hypothetical protein CcaverHIS002_0510700 [Cutaneotrichosporon cavernicola]|nr:hypothetical protein CcaverHIS002_0510700 [Cutaneotrichosporon cavernicola]